MRAFLGLKIGYFSSFWSEKNVILRVKNRDFCPPEGCFGAPEFPRICPPEGQNHGEFRGGVDPAPEFPRIRGPQVPEFPRIGGSGDPVSRDFRGGRVPPPDAILRVKIVFLELKMRVFFHVLSAKKSPNFATLGCKICKIEHEIVSWSDALVIISDRGSILVRVG